MNRCQVRCSYFNRSADGMGGQTDYFTVPEGSRTLRLRLDAGQDGGVTTALLAVEPGQKLAVNVGGRGEDGGANGVKLGHRPHGGWNGGGAGGTDGFGCKVDRCGDGGNGAVDVRTSPYEVGDRVLVAGGAGGGNGMQGGKGGGLTGTDGYSESPFDNWGGAGSQSQGGYGGGNASGGARAQGGQGGDAIPTLGSSPRAGGGGGGGYFGGGGGGGRRYAICCMVGSASTGGGGSAPVVDIQSVPEPYATTTTLVSSADPANNREPVTFTATITTGDPAKPLGGGTVTFLSALSTYRAEVFPIEETPWIGKAYLTLTYPGGVWQTSARYDGYSLDTADSAFTTSRSWSNTINQVVGDPQTITFDAPTDVRLGDDRFALGASSSSGLPVEYTSTTPNVCTITDSGAWPFTIDYLRVVSTGTCTIRTSQLGNRTFRAAEDVVRSFSIGRTRQTITFPTPQGVRAADGDVRLEASASSGLPITYTSMTPDVCTTPGGDVVRTLATGTCTVVAAADGNASFDSAPFVERSFAITKSSQRIWFYSFPDYASGLEDVRPNASATSGLPLTYTSTTPDVCVITRDGLVRPVGAGACWVTADQPGNDIFTAAESQVQAFIVRKRNQTVSFTSNEPVGAEVGDTYRPRATATSGLGVDLEVNGPCTVDDGVVTFGGDIRWPCRVTASQPGNDLYAPADAASQYIWISPSEQVVTFTTSPPADAGVGDSYTPGAEATSGEPVQISHITGPACRMSDGVVTLTSAGGECTVVGVQAGNVGFLSAIGVQTFAVGRGRQSVRFTSTAPEGLVKGDTYTPATSFAPAVTGAAAKRPVTLRASGACRLDGRDVVLTGPGECTLTLDQAGDAEYRPAPQAVRTFEVAKGEQSVTFDAPADMAYGDADAPLVARSTSGLPVTVTSTTADVCTVVEQKVRTIGAGTCVVIASQGGGRDHLAAASVERTFTIAKAARALAIRTTLPAGAAVGEGYRPVVAPTGSSAPVVVATTTPTVCRASDGLVSFTGEGECVVVVDQAGDDNHEAAQRVRQSVTVRSAPTPPASTPTLVPTPSTPTPSALNPSPLNPSPLNPSPSMDPAAGDTDGDPIDLRAVCRRGGPVPRGYTLVEGTFGADRLQGSSADELIRGYSGADRIDGGGGDDIVCGGAGDDVLRGGAGEDRLVGGAGRDTARDPGRSTTFRGIEKIG